MTQTRPGAEVLAPTRPWHATQAPPRPKPLTMLVATASSVIALTLLVAIGEWTDQVLLIPPLAASMALIAGASGTPLGQPRSVIGGQLVSAVTGFVVLAALGQGVWSSGIAGGLALGAMMLLRVAHSPAAATAVIVAATGPSVVPFLALLAAATVILVLVGLVGNRVNKQPYPVFWW
ncbi:HPP family protein [Streptomyces sp. A0958]|uniref:HPP family protein n=1 Tax=Streptomyces sp. A0958 TaxID=2563101 RepID=UPI00109E977B|nr:HPP family protein [Streptomyces sp. A0958]THA65275.1 HPP family protein [Streptomyces sp. A0958]